MKFIKLKFGNILYIKFKFSSIFALKFSMFYECMHTVFLLIFVQIQGVHKCIECTICGRSLLEYLNYLLLNIFGHLYKNLIPL